MMKFILLKHFCWAGQGQMEAPARMCAESQPLSPPESESEGVPVSSGSGPSFKLLFSSVCQSWGWKEWKVPCGAIVGLWGACAAPKQLSSGCRAGVGESGWPWWVGLEGSWPHTGQNLEKAPFTCFCSYFFSTGPGLSPAISLYLFVPHLLCRIYDVGRLCSHNKHYVPCAPIKLFSL